MSEINIHNSLLSELRQIIDKGKQQVAVQVNSALTLTYWHIGKRINKNVLQNKRAEYGKQIVSTLSTQLVQEYGKSFEARNLRRMMQFADFFPDIQIVVPLARQLSWSHFIAIIPIKKQEARLFYAQKASESLWSKRELRKQIERKAFERSEIADVKNQLTEKELEHTFKDPYFLDFLGLKDGYLEDDLESAILKDLYLN